MNNQLDPLRKSPEAQGLETQLLRKIVGQDQAVRELVDMYQVFCAGLATPGRPVGNLLFLGPSGSGKTRLVEATAEILFGDAGAVIKIDCAEFQHSHEIAKLIGSPPGYLGHRETHPLITQEALAQYHSEKLKLSFLLFDEIEKASDALWQLLLGILDKATLTLGDNRRVDLSQTMIFMTSNLGAVEMSKLSSGGIGYRSAEALTPEELDQEIDRVSTDAARRRFSPEFINRIDKIVVFHMLGAADLEQILDIELDMVQQRILGATAHRPFVFRCTEGARAFLLREGTDLKYGARHLKRAIERYLTYPLAKLVATEQVTFGDFVRIDYDDRLKSLVFSKESEGAIVPASLPLRERTAPLMAEAAHGGRAVPASIPSDPRMAPAAQKTNP